ncbi:MAG: DUF721 domain-containing protein [Bacteroidales bacterium]|nr:MAG: DUF721 domain-containing protein [Bacteroidales bacterium]
MRRSNTQKLKEVIKEYIRETNIEDKLKETRLINSWEKVVGKEIARRTDKIYIKKNKLFVYFNSSVVRNELLLHRETIRKNLNALVGEEIIGEIVIR